MTDAVAQGPPSSLSTLHGSVDLPLFFPDATRAVVRGVGPEALQDVGVDAVLVSTAHLATKPGASVIKSLGGVHEFMNWNGPIVSDSGGFQAFSLGSASGLLKVSDKGMKYRFSTSHRFRTLTPESCIEIQVRMGSDIVYCLDLCTSPDADRAAQERSVDLTVSWARTCKATFERLTADRPTRPLLFAVVQGGPFEDLRRRCADELAEIGFDGFGFGGYPIVDGSLVDEVAALPDLLPPGAAIHGLGIGTPGNLVAAWAAGLTLFDCVLPTRNGRRGRLYTALPTEPLAGARFKRPVNLLDERWVREAGPIDDHCDCPACSGYSAAYVAHLFRIEDRYAATLGTLHNLRFYTRLIERLRAGG